MFWSRPLVSEDMREWIESCFDWFDSMFPPPPGPVLPTKSFFRATKGSDPETAKLVLEDVQRLLDIDCLIELQALKRLPAEYRHSYQALSEVAGTYQETEAGRVISYDPEQMHRPIQFISTLAHEVMHARLSGLEDLIPGGFETHELATDLGCIIAGFGVFQMQAADEVGWAGYLSQPSRAYALAYFLRRRDLELTTVAPYLSPRCQKLVRRGFKQVKV